VRTDEDVVRWLRLPKTAVDIALSDLIAGTRAQQSQPMSAKTHELIGIVSLALQEAADRIERDGRRP